MRDWDQRRRGAELRRAVRSWERVLLIIQEEKDHKTYTYASCVRSPPLPGLPPHEYDYIARSTHSAILCTMYDLGIS